MNNFDHLKFIADTRPAGPDKDAAIWAVSEIEQLRLKKEQLVNLVLEIMEYHNTR